MTGSSHVPSAHLPAFPWRAVNKITGLRRQWRTARQLREFVFRGVDPTAFVEGSLCKLLQYCAKNVPYYQHLFDRCGVDVNCPEQLRKIPLLSKQIIKDNFEEITSRHALRLSYQIGATGGSTGSPLQYLINTAPQQVCHEHQKFFFQHFLGYDKRADKVGAFDGVVIPDELARRNIFWQDRVPCRDVGVGRTRFSSFLLNNDTARYYFDYLTANYYNIFFGYPSSIYDLARHCDRLGYTFPYPIKAVQLTSEYASREQIDLIRQVLKTKVFLLYGQGELTFLAHTLDDKYEYWCSPLQGIVEVLAEDGSHVGVGEEGEVVATSFWNRVMPFIRYRTGDRAVYGGHRNGTCYLTAVTGRTQDFVIRKNLSRITLTALVFAQHFHAFSHINVWQIIQDVPGVVAMRIDASSQFSKQDEAELAAAFKRLADIDCVFQYTTDFILTERSKRKFLVQNIPQ